MAKKWISGIKGLSSNFSCLTKQYALNKTYREKGGDICHRGVMHFCERPMDVLDFYEPVRNIGNRPDISRYAEVRADASTLVRDGNKSGTATLKIVNELGYGWLATKCIEYAFGEDRTDIDNIRNGKSFLIKTSSMQYRPRVDCRSAFSVTTSTQERATLLVSLSSVAASTHNKACGFAREDNSIVAATGNKTLSVCQANYSVAASTGAKSICSASRNSIAATIGSNSVSHVYGKEAVAVALGTFSAAIADGLSCCGIAAGISSVAVAESEDSIAMAIGLHSKAKGVLGSTLCFADWGESGDKIHGLVVVKVDGKKIKPGLYYQCINGEIV